MTKPVMTLVEAEAILRGRQSAEMWKLGYAAELVLAHAEQLEARARLLLEKATSPEYDDAVLQNIRATCRYILGETKTVRTLGLGAPSTTGNGET